MRARDPWLDNTRFLAAVLIAVMHLGDQVMFRTGILEELWFATWPYRVPLFVLVAGYFSSAEPLSGRRAVSLLRNVLGVYLVADLIVTVWSGLSYGNWDYHPHRPPFALWFLLSLFLWRAALPLVAHVRWLGPLSVAAALGVGFVDRIGVSFSASRTIALFPIFLLGWYLRRRGLHDLLDRRWVRAAGWVAIVGISVAAATLVTQAIRPVVRFRAGYPGAISEQMVWAGWRGVALALGAVGAVAVLAVMPRRRIPVVTYLGTGSMYIYVLHAMIIIVVGPRRTDWYARIDTVPEVLALLALGAVGAALLASPPVRWALGWLIQPSYTWLFREQAPATPPVGRPEQSPERDRPNGRDRLPGRE